MLGIEKWRFIPILIFLIFGFFLGFEQAHAVSSSLASTTHQSGIQTSFSGGPDLEQLITCSDIDGFSIDRIDAVVFDPDAFSGGTVEMVFASTTSDNQVVRPNSGQLQQFETFTFTPPVDISCLDDIDLVMHEVAQTGNNPLGWGCSTIGEYDDQACFGNRAFSFDIFGELTPPPEVPLVIPVVQNFIFLLSTSTCIESSSGTICSFEYTTTTEEVPVINNTLNLILGIFLFMTTFIFLAVYFKPRRGHLV